MPMLRERKISVNYQEPEVSKDELAMIFNYWIKDVPITKIMRMMQPSRVARNKQPLIYVDIYSILWIYLQSQQITHRRTNAHEMTVRDFAAFFQIWKQGGSFIECYSSLNERPEVKSYATNVYRSLGDRYRREDAERNPGKVSSGNSALAAKQHVLALSHRMKVEGRRALVIFIDDIPIGLIDQLKGLKDIGIHFDTSLTSGDELFKQMNQAKPANTQSASDPPVTLTDDDIDVLDPTGEYEDEGHIRTAEQAEELESSRKLRPRQPSAQPPAKQPDPVLTHVSTATGIEPVITRPDQAPAKRPPGRPPNQSPNQPRVLRDTDDVAELLAPTPQDLSLENLCDEDDLSPYNKTSN